MSTSITSFPFSADKVSELPVVTSLLTTDKILVNAGSTPVTSTITRVNFEAGLNYQPAAPALDEYSEVPPTEEAKFLLNTLITPEESSYLRINAITGQTLPRTASQVRSDISAQPLDLTLTNLALTEPGEVGLNFLELDRSESIDAVANPWVYVRVSTALGSALAYRTPSQTLTDIGGMPISYLVTKSDIAGGARIDDAHVPSTSAMATYIDARIGAGVKDDSDDTLASAATLDLDSTSGPQVDLLGTTPPTEIVLAVGDQKIVRFKGVMTISPSADVLTPGGVPLTTAVDSYATFIGRDGGAVSITNYFATADFTVSYGGDFSTSGPFSTGGSFATIGDFSSGGLFFTQSNFVVSGAFPLTQFITAATSVTFPPGAHTLAAEVGNYSTTAQSIPAATRTYIAGSAITIPSSKMKIGSKFSWKFNMTKTAAGNAASTFDVCVGTLGTTGDTARLSFTKPAGTAAADEGFVIIEAVVRGPLSASGVMVGEFVMYHNLASTGHATIPTVCVNTVSGTFDVTTANLIVGVCLTSGASDDITVQQVSAQAFNL